VQKLIVHLANGRDWRAAKSTGQYAPPMLSADGLIHLSTPELVHLPANAMYSDTRDLVLLWVDPARVSAEIRYELPEPGARAAFPHLYGPLNIDAVIAETPLEPWKRGAFELPPRPDGEGAA
jgi:uncharacterized protein (DUF952 family)